MIYVSERRLDELRSSLVKTTSDNSLRIRSLASIVDQIISMGTTVGNIVRLMTRHCYAAIENRSCWDQIVSISPGVREELSFWFTKFFKRQAYVSQTQCSWDCLLGCQWLWFNVIEKTFLVRGPWNKWQGVPLCQVCPSLSCPQVNRLVSQVVYR